MPTFALVSPCGTGNLGDAAIQDSMIAGIRRRYVHARIVAATLNPRDTEQRHGLATYPLAAGEPQTPPLLVQRSEVKEGRVHMNLFRGSLRLIRRALQKTARLILPASVRAILRKALNESGHLVGGYRHLDSVDTLIFSGGGQLDDSWGGPGQHPWAMLKWAILARLRGARVLFLSVGYGTLQSGLSRLMVRLALSLAEYRSYRDAGSLILVRNCGLARMDSVVPDLAYARPDRHERGPLVGPVRMVGICPIAYGDPRGWPIHDPRAFEDYLQRLVQVVDWLVLSGRRLVFFASGGADNRVADEVILRLSCRLPPGCEERVRRSPVMTVDGFLQEAASADVVVASRLHSLLLSHLACTPTIALIYERKVEVLVQEMEQARFALNIDSFSLLDFQRAFVALEENWPTVYRQQLSKQRDYRTRLEHQFDQVLGTTCVDNPPFVVDRDRKNPQFA